MRIPCPICGPRDSREFRILGEAHQKRPEGAVGAEPEGQVSAFAGYVYLRDNLPGPMREYWFHASGCRGWLVVQRNAVTHEVLEAILASEAGK